MIGDGIRALVLRTPKLLLACSLVACFCATAYAQVPEKLYQEMHWRMIGPFRGGRTRAASGVATQSNVFYIGAVDGGVWKSTDYGRTWRPIFDSQNTQSIGAIAVAPSDPSVIYVASGEGLHRPDLSVGNGIYKSEDAGKTWQHLGLRDGQQFPALAVDPHDPNRVFAAVLGHPYGANAERGIFRSTDGGQSWTKVLYKDQNTGGYDVEINPADPNIVYATLWQERLGPFEDNNSFQGTTGGVFKSTDGGNTWRKLAKGLPDNLTQANVAIAASNPNRVFATVATTEPTAYATDKGMGFFRSDDAGESWTRITADPRAAMKIGGGDLPVVRVDPKNADAVYCTGIVTVRSRDGGKTWESIRGAPGGDDYQNLWINPENPDILLLVSDQGAVVTVNSGETWSSWYNQPTAQLFHVITTNSFPYKVCGAQQESGSVCIASRGNDGEITFRDWHPVGVIEYGYVAPDPLNDDIVYGAGRNEVSRFHWSTGQVENVTPIPIRDGYRVTRTEPLVFSPVDPHLLYYAANVVFATSDGGHSWQKISGDLTREKPGVPPSVGDQSTLKPKADNQLGSIYTLAPSFHNVNTLWAGTDDGLVWRTTDGGKNWANITPPQLTPWSKVSLISASRFSDDTAYVAVNRFRVDDLHPYIYRTHDAGKTWQLITNSLPDNSPVNAVREDPVRKGLLFAGTETAVWVSFDDGEHWQSLQLNLPHASMRDLWIHDNDLVVATHGRSFWILDDIAPLRQFNSDTAQADVHLFQPGFAYRVRRDNNTDTPLPADEPAGENPPDGALLDYYLNAPAAGAVTLEIFDSHGKLVRRYSSTDRPSRSPEDLQKEMIPAYWLKPFAALSTTAGMHRWVWDLRYEPPTTTQHEYPISAIPYRTPHYPLGPLVLPGTYSVRLTSEGKTQTVTLVVKMDPRIKEPVSALKENFEINMRLAGLVNESSEAVLRARSVREQLSASMEKSKGSLSASIKHLSDQVIAVLDGSGTDTPSLSGVNGDAIEVYKNTEKSDAPPTVAQVTTASQIEQTLGPLLKKWHQLETTDLHELNEQLKRTGMPEVRPEQPPTEPETGENEE